VAQMKKDIDNPVTRAKVERDQRSVHDTHDTHDTHTRPRPRHTHDTQRNATVRCCVDHAWRRRSR
jgi:hypothetical protein